jgi:NAD-dependent deacetylase
MLELIRRIGNALGSSGRVTILTGAGVSAESGIATFRDMGGLWEEYSLEEVATPEGYAARPSVVLDFYNERRRHLRTVEENDAHRALARLEEHLGDRFTLITQNIDDLHERAGSQRVLHMHGELLKVRCVDCAVVIGWPGDVTMEDACDECGGHLRPHIVWFGEMPFFMDREIPFALQAEVFISIGTSGTVYPAAGFVLDAKGRGSFCAEINLEPSESSDCFDAQLTGKAGEMLPRVVDALLELEAS